MADFLNENEALVQTATMGLRGPDGAVVENVPLYRIVKRGEVNPESGLTKEEMTPAKDWAKMLAPKFKQYMEGKERQKL